MTGAVFSISIDAIDAAAECGSAALTSLIVIACGTGGDNITSKWSVTSVEAYTGLSRQRIKRAIQLLLDQKILTKGKDATQAKPIYKIKRPKNCTSIWLPKCFVTGVEGEGAPVLERARQLGGVDYLHLLLRLYEHQNLPEDSGLPTNLITTTYTQTSKASRGNIVIGWFKDEGSNHFGVPPFNSFGSSPHNCWHLISALRAVGAIEMLAMVFEGDDQDSMPLWPSHGRSSERFETDVINLQGDRQSELDADGFIVPENRIPAMWPATYASATLRGVYRLKYRPDTAMTRAWAGEAKMKAECLKKVINLTDWPLSKKRQNAA